LRASPLQGCDFDGFQQGGESSRKVQLRAAGETTRFQLESAWNLTPHDFPVVQDYLSSPLEIRVGITGLRYPVALQLNKLRGRGRVELVEQPSPANNYTAVVLIRDPERGDDSYEFELTWS
jgi:hypothetical protein